MNILITGCSRGLGRGLLETYLNQAEVKKVWGVSMNPDRLKDLQTQFGAKLVVVSAQVSETSSQGKIAEALGNETLDLLINCAGTMPDEASQFSLISRAHLQEGFEGNTYSAFFTTQACLPALQKSKSPKVVSISSLMGSIDDNTSGGYYAYRMSKAALNMFNKCFSLGNSKITAIVLHPGWVKTEMGGDGAPTTIEESIQGMVKVIAGLNLKQTGHFYDFEGDSIPW